MSKVLQPGPGVIKLEFIRKLKIKHNDWLLADRVCKQPIMVLYFEFVTAAAVRLKVENLLLLISFIVFFFHFFIFL